MIRNDLTRAAAAIVCALVVSATCLFAAVGPAQLDAGGPAAAMAARYTA